MSQRADAINDDGGSVKVGTTGTIGSLMTRELESMKHSEKASSSAHRKQQTGPVSVPCGATPRKTLQRRNQANENGAGGSGSSSNSSIGHTYCANHVDAKKPRHMPWRNRHRAPILVSDGSPVDRNAEADKVERKVHTYIVEVVDLKCSNPMSNRIKKLGFSKLSESIS